MAAYFSVLEPGDRIMGMNLAHGGHLTHGMALNFSGRLYEVHAYGVRQDTERIDYDAIEAQAQRGPARSSSSAAPSAYPRIMGLRADGRDRRTTSARCCSSTWPTSPASWPPASTRARSRTRTSSRPPPTRPCAARAAGSIFSRHGRCPPALDPARLPGGQDGTLAALADRPDRLPGHPGRAADARHRRQGRGVQAGRRGAFRRDQRRTVENAAVLAETLAGQGARVVSGGTDNHLMLVDVTPLGVTGKEAEHLLDEIGITVNKNAIPFDTLPPNTASGIRIGTPGHHDARLRAGRDARRSAGSSSRRSATATSRPSRPAWPPRSARS